MTLFHQHPWPALGYHLFFLNHLLNGLFIGPNEAKFPALRLIHKLKKVCQDWAISHCSSSDRIPCAFSNISLKRIHDSSRWKLPVRYQVSWGRQILDHRKYNVNKCTTDAGFGDELQLFNSCAGQTSIVKFVTFLYCPQKYLILTWPTNDTEYNILQFIPAEWFASPVAKNIVWLPPWFLIQVIHFCCFSITGVYTAEARQWWRGRWTAPCTAIKPLAGQRWCPCEAQLRHAQPLP